MQSLVRGCEDKPIYTNQVFEDATYRTYYRACKQELCNGGSGKSSVSSSTGNNGGASNLLVPGIGAGTQIYPKVIVVVFMASLAMWFNK